jgi:hypothetical protein
VKEENQLQNKVRNAPSGLVAPTSIELCSKNITLSHEIKLTNKNIRFICKLSNATEKCVIDAKGKTRHFNITSSIITFEGIVFSNGNATSRGHWWIDAALNSEISQGGSLLAYNSTVKMIECDFIHNNAAIGGAISSTEQTIVDMTRCNMRNNFADNGTLVGYGGAVFAYNSDVTLSGSDNILRPTILEGNTARVVGGAMYVAGQNVSFRTKRGYFAFRSNIAVRTQMMYSH